MIRVLDAENLDFGYKAEFLTFSGGEEHVVVDVEQADRILIDARVDSSSELMRLLAVTDAAKRQGIKEISLFLPYFPGARQDRVDPGTGFAFTAKIIANIINSQGYDKVIIVDPHSEVTPALLNGCIVIGVEKVVPVAFAAMNGFRPDAVISPDAGAEKRAAAVAKLYKVPVISARKHRDAATGKLTGFSLDKIPDTLRGNFLVVDDICDGGGTFLGLAAEFDKQRQMGDKLVLWVTHGIFSQGYSKLLCAYDHIYTTDSLRIPDWKDATSGTSVGGRMPGGFGCYRMRDLLTRIW